MKMSNEMINKVLNNEPTYMELSFETSSATTLYIKENGEVIATGVLGPGDDIHLKIPMAITITGA